MKVEAENDTSVQVLTLNPVVRSAHLRNQKLNPTTVGTLANCKTGLNENTEVVKNVVNLKEKLKSKLARTGGTPEASMKKKNRGFH